MATQIGIRELRDGLTSVIRRVARGETIEVTNHGKPVAVISPIAAGRYERLLATGELTQTAPPFDPNALEPVRAATGSISASEALEEDRADR